MDLPRERIQSDASATEGAHAAKRPSVDHAVAGDAVFVSHLVTLDAPAGLVAERLRATFEGPGFRSATREAISEHEPLLFRAGIGPISKQVDVACVSDYARGPAIIFPLRWSATGPAGDLFPILDANLEVSPESVDCGARTRLRLTGSYAPPLGSVGRVLDYVLLRRVAVLTTRGFLVRLARQLVPDDHAAISEADVIQLGADWDEGNPATS